MLPTEPPTVSPVDMEVDGTYPSDEEEDGPIIQLSSIEINMLIHQYLTESNFTHTAFTLLNESKLADTDLYKHYNPREPTHKSVSKMNGHKNSPTTPDFGNLHGRLPPAGLVKKLWKAVKWEEVERHVGADGQPYKERCTRPFYLIRPHVCPTTNPSAVDNPTTPFPVLNMIQPTSPPEVPSDAEDEAPQAGPSKRKAQPTVATAKRRSRRNSETSTALTRSPSPNGRKKRAPTGDEDDFVDTPDKAKTGAGGRGGRRKATQDTEGTGKEKLVIPPSVTPRRSASPTKQDQSDVLSSAIKLGEGNPKWFKASEIGLFTEHTDIVNAVAWSPINHDLLASGANDTSAKLWELTKSTDSGVKKLQLVPGPAGTNPVSMGHQTVNKRNPVTCLSWHPAGTALVTGAQEGSTRTFSASGIGSGDFSSQGTNLAVNAIKFSPNGKLIMMASVGHTVQIFDWRLRSKGIMKAHSDAVKDIDWLDDQVFASCGSDFKIFVHRVEDARHHYMFDGHKEEVMKIQWSPAHLHPLPSSNQRYLASIADDGCLMVWEMPIYPLARHKSSSVGSASPSKRTDRDSTVGDDYQFETAAKYLVCKWKVVEEGKSDLVMRALDWCRDKVEGEMLLAAGGQDCTIKIYDLYTQRLVHSLKGFEDGTGCLAFSPEGFRGKCGAIAGGGWDPCFSVWDVETGEVLKEFALDVQTLKLPKRKRERPFVTSIAWKPDGEHVAVGLYTGAIMTFYVGDLRRAKPAPASATAAAGQATVEGGAVGEGASEGGGRGQEEKEKEKEGEKDKEGEKKDGDGDVLMK